MTVTAHSQWSTGWFVNWINRMKVQRVSHCFLLALLARAGLSLFSFLSPLSFSFFLLPFSPFFSSFPFSFESIDWTASCRTFLSSFSSYSYPVLSSDTLTNAPGKNTCFRYIKAIPGALHLLMWLKENVPQGIQEGIAWGFCGFLDGPITGTLTQQLSHPNTETLYSVYLAAGDRLAGNKQPH